MRRVLSIFLLLLAAFSLRAQDIHYSQYFAAPLLTNPSNAGYFQGSYRLGANWKAQWPFASKSAAFTYNTYGAYADFSLLEKKINNQDWAGLALAFNRDVAGDGSLGYTEGEISLAYHKGFDRFNRYMISVGFQGSYVQRSIDFEKLYFNNQWDGKDFDLDIKFTDPFRFESYSYIDMGAGISFRAAFENGMTISAGGALHHLNRPQDSFYGDEDNRLGLRPTFNGNFDYQINKQYKLYSSFYWNYEKGAQEYILGAMMGMKPKAVKKDVNTQFFLGTYYRWDDAAVVLTGVQYNNTRLLLNYDFTVSGLFKANKGVGSLEMSLVHTGLFPSIKNFNRKQHCPNF